MLSAAVQQLQQQFVQQQENFQKQQADLQKQQTCARTNCKAAGHFAKNIVKARRTGEWFEHFFCRGQSKLVSEFIYKPAYFKRYETIFAKRCQSWSDEEKIMLVL